MNPSCSLLFLSWSLCGSRLYLRRRIKVQVAILLHISDVSQLDPPFDPLLWLFERSTVNLVFVIESALYSKHHYWHMKNWPMLKHLYSYTIWHATHRIKPNSAKILRIPTWRCWKSGGDWQMMRLVAVVIKTITCFVKRRRKIRNWPTIIIDESLLSRSRYLSFFKS